MTAPMLTRTEGWDARLAEFLEERRRTPFAWGANDCSSFALDWILLATGRRVAEVTWWSVNEAAREIERHGSLVAYWLKLLGPERQNWRELRRGDVAMVDLAGRDTVMVCAGRTLCGPGEQHLEHLPIKAARLIWRIG